MALGSNFRRATAQGLADFKARERAHREAEEQARCEAEEHDHYREAPTPQTTRSMKRKRSIVSGAATRIVKQRRLNSPQPESAPPAPSTLPLALCRGRRPAPFPMFSLSPLYETFEL
jgi:hypothetical protein